MKKFIILSFLIAGFGIAQAQDSDPFESTQPVEEVMDDEEQAAEEVEEAIEKEEKPTEKEIKAVEKVIKGADKDLDDAQKKYADALLDYHKSREDYMKSQNALEEARVALRQAERAKADADKLENPVVPERYKVNVNDIYSDMSKGEQYGFNVFLLGSEGSKLTKLNFLSKNADSEFRKYMKQFSYDRIKKQKGEIFVDNVLIPEISPTLMDLYVDFDNEEEGTNMIAYFNLGGDFLSSSNDPNGAEAAKDFLEQFARQMRYLEVERELEVQEKELAKLQKDLEKANKGILKGKEDIHKAERSIDENAAARDELEQLIMQQTDAVAYTRQKLDKVQ